MKTLSKIIKTNSLSLKKSKLFNINEMSFFWRFKSAENKEKESKEKEKEKEIKPKVNLKSKINKGEIGLITDKKALNQRKKVKDLNSFIDTTELKPEFAQIYKFYLTTDNSSWDRFHEYRVMLKSNVNDGKFNVNLELSNKFICCLKSTEKKKYSFSDEELEAISEVIGTNKDDLENLISEYCIYRAKQQNIREKVIINEELPSNKDEFTNSKGLEKYPEYLYLQNKQINFGFNSLGFSREEYDSNMKEKYSAKERSTDCKKLIKEFMRPQY